MNNIRFVIKRAIKRIEWFEIDSSKYNEYYNIRNAVHLDNLKTHRLNVQCSLYIVIQ